jgi:uncharacterized protein (DUF697 family)
MKPMNPIAQAAQALAQKTFGNTATAGGSAAAGAARIGFDPASNKTAAPPLDKLDALAASLKQRMGRKALWGSAAALIPLPFIDLAVDVALLSNMLSDIHEAFGLSPAQLEALDPGKRHRTFAAIQWVGNRAIGQLVTQAVVKRIITTAGVKLTAGQMSKAVPIAGQIASAALNYGTLRHIVYVHIDDCVKVLKQAA